MSAVTTTTDNTTGNYTYIGGGGVRGLGCLCFSCARPVSVDWGSSCVHGYIYFCPWCSTTTNTHCNPTPDSAPESAEGEDMSLIDERQVEVLDNFRNASDVAARHAQSKVDRATLMKIQAEALIAESRELVSELNENVPIPNESGADIGPIPGAGGAQR